jgi:hypothetical protein
MAELDAFAKNITIKGPFWYEREITRLVGRLSNTLTGRALGTKINASHGMLVIKPTGDKSTVQGLTESAGWSPGTGNLAVMTFSPNSNAANTAQQVHANVGLSVKTLRQFPGWGPDEVLLHEMVHAGRILGRDAGSSEMEEEFFAILVTDIYVSEKGKPSNFLRNPLNHEAMGFPLKDSQVQPYAFLDANFDLIEKYCGQHPNIAPMIAIAPADFNPIRDYLNRRNRPDTGVRMLRPDIDI